MIFWLGCGSNVICCGRVLVGTISLISNGIGPGRCGLDSVVGCRCTGDMRPIVRASLLRILRLVVCMRGSPCVFVAGFISLAVCYCSWLASWLRCQGFLWGLLGGMWGVVQAVFVVFMSVAGGCSVLVGEDSGYLSVIG